MRALVLIPMEWQGAFRRQDDIIETDDGDDLQQALALQALAQRGIVRMLDTVQTADMEPSPRKRGYSTR